MDRPILFSAPMVRALLDGRKTQTRRVLKAEIPTGMHPDICPYSETGWGLWETANDRCMCRPVHVPYFAGDRLWVRETFRVREGGIIRDGAGGQMDYVEPEVVYGADVGLQAGKRRGQLGEIWKPAIHLPRTASRLTLAVTDVRVQRLQEISEDDCVAEGAFVQPLRPYDRGQTFVYPDPAETWRTMTPRAWFHELWNSITGPDAWDSNPWVVALTFTVQRRNIDAADVLDPSHAPTMAPAAAPVTANAQPIFAEDGT